MELSIINRIEQFRNIVKDTEVTDDKNNILPLEYGLIKVYEILEDIKNTKSTLYIIGNGGSSAISSHAAVDFFNVEINARALSDMSMFTCMANDNGFENSFSKMTNQIISSNDFLIAISSSGASKNIINADNSAKKKNSTVVTLSGFSVDNELRSLGDINFWTDSSDYGMVEIAHQFILHNLSDRFL
jgi:D-sedoheptulose 7-phosphate isomerase